MEMSKELMEAIETHEIFRVSVLGHIVIIRDTIVVMWIIMAILIAFAYIFTRKLVLIPEGKQSFVEVLVDGVNSFTKSVIGHHWRYFAPYFGTISLFLLLSNIISIFNIIPNLDGLFGLTHWEFLKNLSHFKIRPPTKNINVTVCMAVMTMVIVVVSAIKIKTLSGWLKSFLEPMPIILPMKILEYFVRPLSLSLRLFGNILGAFIIMELIYMIVPAFVPIIFSSYFDLIDGILQACVFVFLSSLYISEAIE